MYSKKKNFSNGAPQHLSPADLQEIQRHLPEAPQFANALALPIWVVVSAKDDKSIIATLCASEEARQFFGDDKFAPIVALIFSALEELCAAYGASVESAYALKSKNMLN